MSDNINENEILPEGSDGLSKEDKIRAIKRSQPTTGTASGRQCFPIKSIR